jgi:hypothetical protein
MSNEKRRKQWSKVVCTWERIPGMSDRGYVTECGQREPRKRDTCPTCKRLVEEVRHAASG